MEENIQQAYDIHFEPSNRIKGQYLILDTETTGYLSKEEMQVTDPGMLPRIIQVAWLLFDEDGKLIRSQNRFISQEQPIPASSVRIHGLDDTLIQKKGEPPSAVWNDFLKDLNACSFVIAHHIDFDIPLIENELKLIGIQNPFAGKRTICTMKQGKDLCKLPAENSNDFRYPTLEELYKILFTGRLTHEPLSGLHNAMTDASIAAKVFFHMLKMQHIQLSDAREEPFRMPGLSPQSPHMKNRFFVQIVLPTFLTIVLLLLAIFLLIIPRFRESIMFGKRQMIRELTNSATSILDKYHEEERAGLLTRATAQQEAIARIRSLRYGEEMKDYFWICDMEPNMVMHPYRPDLVGQSLKDFSDPHGKKLFVEMTRVARQNGEGYVDYMWQWKDDSAHVVPKLSFVKSFAPWGWIVGTGIYLEDVRIEINLLTRRLLFISLGISLMIALLLTYITLQSMKIDRKRRKAEDLLVLSREKYKTLADATTEGLILVMDQKMIFTNNKVHEMTGFSENELTNQPFSFLVSDQNTEEVIKLLGERELPEGQIEMTLCNKTGDPLEAIVSFSSIVFFEQKGQLVTLKNITLPKPQENNPGEVLSLLEFSGIGFIRILLDSRGKFLYAGKEVVKMLGFHDFSGLSMYGILDFFSDPEEKKRYRKQLLQEGILRKVMVHVKRKDGDVLLAMVSMRVITDGPNQLIAEGMILDITAQEQAKRMMEEIISGLQSHAASLKMPVLPLTDNVSEIPMEATVKRILEVMAHHCTDALLVTDESSLRIGIITRRELNDRILLYGVTDSTKAYEIMTAPVPYLEDHATLDQALIAMERRGNELMVVRNPEGKMAGIIRKERIIRHLTDSFDFLESRIEQASSVTEIKKIYQVFQLYLSQMIGRDQPPEIIARTMASVSDRITARLIGLALDELGPPPVPFAFIALGSEGRMEQTLATDQDNAILYQDVEEKKEEEVHQWFVKLGTRVCTWLDTTGFRFCKGNIMAMNPLWCQPIRVWKKYFSTWITNTEPRNLMEVSIFFDLRPVYGDNSLTEDLRRHIQTVSAGNGVFFYNLTENASQLKQPVGITGSIHIQKREEKDIIDLKMAISPYVIFGRIYALHNHLIPTSTSMRFDALYQKQIITQSLYREAGFGYRFLMQLRLRHQARQYEKGESINNMLALQDLTETEEVILRKIIHFAGELQGKLNIDFKSSVL